MSPLVFYGDKLNEVWWLYLTGLVISWFVTIINNQCILSKCQENSTTFAMMLCERPFLAPSIVYCGYEIGQRDTMKCIIGKPFWTRYNLLGLISTSLGMTTSPGGQLCCFLHGCVRMKSKEMGSFLSLK